MRQLPYLSRFKVACWKRVGNSAAMLIVSRIAPLVSDVTTASSRSCLLVPGLLYLGVALSPLRDD